jgi:hypothetical protein
MSAVTMQLDGSVRRGEGLYWRQQAHSADERIRPDL